MRPVRMVRTSTVALLLAMACASAAATEPRSMEAYVALALDKLEENHVNRTTVDWKSQRATAIESAKVVTTYEDAHMIIREVMRQLGELHTFIVPPQPSQPQMPGIAEPVKIPAVATRAMGEARYISIPTFAATDASAEKSFAIRIREALVDSKSPTCGLIVDLRQNQGGNMIPGLLGLGPLVGQGMLGGVVGAATPQYWHYMSNRVLISDESRLLTPDARVADPDSQIVRGVKEMLRIESGVDDGLASKPLAVLLGPNTASAAEGIAVILMGRDKARSFGRPTKGFTSGNIGVRMPDGAILIITVGHFTDRRGRTYRSRITPDELVESSRESDRALESAGAWLSTQGCGAKN